MMQKILVETRLAYDSHGNVLSKTQTLWSQSLGDKTLTFNFTYDSADRLTGTTYLQDGAIPSAKPTVAKPSVTKPS